MDPLLAIGLIGGGLVAIKVLGEKETAGSAPESGDAPGTGANPAIDIKPDVSANASTMGYRLLTKEEYDKNGVQQGEYYVLRDENGNIVGTVVGTEGGQVFQNAQGETRIRTTGDVEIEEPAPANTGIVPPGIKTAPAPTNRAPIKVSRDHRGLTPPIINVPSQTGNKTATNSPKLSVTKPKNQVASKLLDERIRKAARNGIRFPM